MDYGFIKCVLFKSDLPFTDLINYHNVLVSFSKYDDFIYLSCQAGVCVTFDNRS